MTYTTYAQDVKSVWNVILHRTAVDAVKDWIGQAIKKPRLSTIQLYMVILENKQ